jgi:outer membrane receptor protein involved in Fe transport
LGSIRSLWRGACALALAFPLTTGADDVRPSTTTGSTGPGHAESLDKLGTGSGLRVAEQRGPESKHARDERSREDPPESRGLDREAPPPGDGKPVELPEQVVRLPRARATDPTSSATVVQADKFAGEAKGVAELVATAPGVAVREQGGLGQLATVSIRGASADGVRVLLDGLPLNTGAGGGVDLSRIPRHWISSVEIVRGAEGARWGAGALGGVVNLVTRPAGGDAWSAEVGGGSWRTYTVGADAAAGGETWGLVGALSLNGTDGDFPYVYDRTLNQPGGTVERTRRTRAGGSRRASGGPGVAAGTRSSSSRAAGERSPGIRASTRTRSSTSSATLASGS